MSRAAKHLKTITAKTLSVVIVISVQWQGGALHLTLERSYFINFLF